jgi:hypothetical protein
MNVRNRIGVRRSVLILLGTMALSASLLASPASAARTLQLAFVQQPTAITAGQPIDPAVTVAVLNRSGDLVTNKVYAITIALASNPGGGSLFGTTTVNTVEGVATFSDLTVDQAGSPKTLVASNPEAVPATSNGFAVTGFTVQCPASPCGFRTGNTNKNNPTNGEASVPVQTCGAAVCPFFSQDVVSPAQCGDQPCLNNAGMAVFPPSNATGVVTFLLENYFAPLSGGIGNRPVFLIKDDGTVLILEKCGNPPGNEACILNDSAIQGSIVRTLVQFPPNDPRVQK